MRTSLFFFAALLGAGSGQLAAQTTGVPGINDYSINGIGSATTSCTLVPVGGSILSRFSVSTNPGALVFFFFAPCPCVPGAQCVPFSSCTFLPMTACGGTSNQSIDLDLACALPPLFVPANALGEANLDLFVLFGLTFSTQAFIVDPAGGGCAAPALPGTLTQAFDVFTVPV